MRGWPIISASAPFTVPLQAYRKLVKPNYTVKLHKTRPSYFCNCIVKILMREHADQYHDTARVLRYIDMYQ